MQKLFLLLGFTVLLFGCNDGDIIEYEINFEEIETINYCGDLVLYKIKEDPFESLSIQLNATFEDFINDYINGDGIKQYSLSVDGNSFVYRSYGNAYSASLASNLFCSDIPPNLSITNDDISSEGTVTVTTSLVEDDGDGIPAAFEDDNLDEDNDPSTNPTDTDADGIPDYLDFDDDNDNVPTANENPNYTFEEGLANAQDTDEDGIPDYLDSDDDGDGVNTIDEENETQNQNPIDDITDNSVGADYLNPNIAFEVLATAYRTHIIKQAYTIDLTVENFTISLLQDDYYEFGSMIINSDPCPCSREVEVDFN